MEKVARACQGELTLAQTRHTARAAALTVPLLLACWYLTRSVDALAAPLAALTVISAMLAGATLATTGLLARWMPVPRSLPTVVAWAGTGTSVALALTTLTLAVTVFLTAAWPLLLAGSRPHRHLPRHPGRHLPNLPPLRHRLRRRRGFPRGGAACTRDGRAQPVAASTAASHSEAVPQADRRARAFRMRRVRSYSSV